MKEESVEQSLDGDVLSILDDDDPIPFKFLKWQTYNSLSLKLDPVKELHGNDWRMMAEGLGYSMEEIINFQFKQAQHGSNTIKILQDYCGTQDSTINKLYTALEKLNRSDVLDVLKESLPDVQRAYHESLRKKHSHHESMTEHSCGCSSCDTAMSLPNEHFNSCYLEQRKCMNSINGYPMMNSHHPMVAGNKHYQRQKSIDNSLMMSGMASRSHGYEHTSPEFKRLRSVPLPDSMVVRGHDSRSQFLRDYEPMEQTQIIRDEPVSPAHVMMRDRQMYNHPPGLPVSMSGICRSKEFETSYHQHHVSRPGLKLEIPSPMDGYKHHIQDNFCSPSPTPTTPSTPLLQLTKLANEKKFQPDESYNDLMRLNQDEEALLCRASQLQAQMEDMERMGTSPSHPHVQGTSQRMEMKERPPIKIEDCGARPPKASEPPNTFPLRLKSSSSSSNSVQLSKSVSVPNNMKPAEFKKAFRHIKVFVTYAADDKKHTQRVINLCKCLMKNGFTCCVDFSSKSIQDEDPGTWCYNRFEEADFVLVVMSPKYRREVDSCEMDNDADDSDSMDEADHPQGSRSQRLHTKQIYRLMYREYLHNNQRNGRFVPLLFQGMTRDLIPDWMMIAYGKLVYVWPEQYKDLLWMLTKPEHRVPEHIAPVINRSIHNSEEKENGDGLDIGHDSE